MTSKLELPQRPVALLLDFDGVILQSTRLKNEAFLEIYAEEEPAKREAVESYLLVHGGVTRRVKFQYFEQEIFGRSTDVARIDELSERFACLVRSLVREAPYVAGALDLLSGLSGKTDLHLISGTPLDELMDIIIARQLPGHFVSVQGAPQTKLAAFQHLLTVHGYSPDRLLAVGDATTEMDAARCLGIPFLGIVNPGEANLFPADVPTLPSLEGLAELLAF